MKLSIELIPSELWGKNLRLLMGEGHWSSVSRIVRDKAAWTCEACGVKPEPSMLHCHEIWRWDDVNYVQRLQGFVALCIDCHAIKHMGLAKIKNIPVKVEQLYIHAAKVNGCSVEDFKKHEVAAWDSWRQRNKRHYTLDLGDYKGMVTATLISETDL